MERGTRGRADAMDVKDYLRLLQRVQTDAERASQKVWLRRSPVIFQPVCPLSFSMSVVLAW